MMHRYRFLWTPRWLGWFALACAAAVVCALLGQWQYSRHLERQEAISRVVFNYDAQAVPFAEASPYFSKLPADREWSRVSVRGTYEAAGQRIVRNRPNGQPGYEVLVPFTTESGEVIAVDRGWLPLGNKRSGYPDEVPPPPSGEITLTGWLRPGEADVGRDAPEGQIATIHLPALARATGLPVETGAYLVMGSEQDAATGQAAAARRPEPLARPTVDPGSHLSYSWQWYAFGILFFVGLGYSARMEARVVDDGVPRPARRDTRKNDQEDEDRLLDAWEESRPVPRGSAPTHDTSGAPRP